MQVYRETVYKITHGLYEHEWIIIQMRFYIMYAPGFDPEIFDRVAQSEGGGRVGG